MLPVIGVVSLERARETEGEKKRSLVRRSEEKEGKREREKEREEKKRKKRIRRSTRTFTRAHACASESPLLGKYCSFIGCDVAAITGETSIGSSNVSQTLLPATSTSVMGVRLNSHRS